MRATGDRDRNLARTEQLVEAAVREGARLVALPEMFAWRGPQSEESAHAEEVPGPTTEFASALARNLSIVLVAGSILERTGEGNRCYNTTLIFDTNGELLGRYRKIHLFDVAIEGHVEARESRTRTHGAEPVCIDTEFGRLGLAICYDLRFPELFRRLSERGAEIFVVPSAFTAPTGAAHWHVLVRARAIENQCYVVAPNQVGPTVHGFDDYGHSIIVDPWGRVLEEAGEEDPEIVTAEISAERLAYVRRSLPALEHRRLA